VGEDQVGAGVALGEVEGVLTECRDAATGVDQDRHPALVGEGDELLDRRLVHRELLGTGMQLDPTGAGVEAALSFGEGAVVGIDPAEGDEAPVGGRRRGQRLLVGGRVTAGLVHREGDAARPGQLQRRNQLLRLLPVGVRVVATDVSVGVEQRQGPRLPFGRIEPPPRLELNRLDRVSHGRRPSRRASRPPRAVPGRCRS
jgi:hypothetical protein